MWDHRNQDYAPTCGDDHHRVVTRGVVRVVTCGKMKTRLPSNGIRNWVCARMCCTLILQLRARMEPHDTLWRCAAVSGANQVSHAAVDGRLSSTTLSSHCNTGNPS